MVIPNCLNNKEVGNKGLQSGQFKLLLVSAKPDSGKVREMNGSMLLRPVRVSVNLNESPVSTEGNLTTSEMIWVTAVSCAFLIPDLLPLENLAEGIKKKIMSFTQPKDHLQLFTGKLPSCS